MIQGYWKELAYRFGLALGRGWVMFSEAVSLSVCFGFAVGVGLAVGYGYGSMACNKPSIVITPPKPQRIMPAIETIKSKKVQTIEVTTDGND